MPEGRTTRNQVFVSYSHADEEYLKRLRVHLNLLERRNIKIWTDKDIEPGMRWQDEITSALAKTKVAILMISTDFLNSDFITRQELPPLLAAAQDEGVEILPVLVKPSAFGDIEIEPLSRYQAVNMGRPLVKLKDDAEREEEFVRILQVIRKHMEGARRPPPQTAAAPSRSPLGAPARQAAEQPVAVDDENPATETMDGEAGDEELLPLDEALCADLDAMLNDPRAQALAIQGMTDEGPADLILVTEGRDGAVLLEILGNEELPAAFRLGREAQRHLVETLGFNPPEIRGDRFWSLVAADEIDLVEVTAVVLTVLADIFAVPAEDVSWQVLEQ